jgi:mRNA interferase MazF
MAKRGDHRLGSIWIVSFDPSIGTEIRKTRPGLIISGTLFNQRRSKVTVLPFSSARPNDPRLSPAVVSVDASPDNGLAVDSLLVCIEPMTFDKARLTQYLGHLETDLLQQVQTVLKQYLALR